MKIALSPTVGQRLGFVAALALLAALTPPRANAGPQHFAEWAEGRISSVDPGQHILVLRVDRRDTPETFHWNKDSRLWRTGGPKDGQPVEGGVLKMGDAVKVQFHKSAKGEPAVIVKIVEAGVRE